MTAMQRRQTFGEKMIDLAHIIFGSLVIGQFLSEEPLSWGLLAGGILALLILYWLSYVLLGGE